MCISCIFQSVRNNLVEVLKLQLGSSVSTIEGDSPLFVPKPGVELIHSHAKLFETHLKDSSKLKILLLETTLIFVSLLPSYLKIILVLAQISSEVRKH